MEKAEKVEKVEYKAGSSPWLPLLAIITTLFSVGLVAVTVLTYVDLHSLDEADLILRREIEALQSKLESARMDGQLPVTVDKEEEDPDDKRNAYESEAGSKHKRIQQQNFFGAILQAQEAVFEKYCHKPNSTCPDGIQGEKGAIGDPGSPGSTGQAGLVGAKGQRGNTGASGFKGPMGDKGNFGSSGSPGPQGLVGIRGISGDRGPDGVQGKTGPAGLKGPKGLIGETGLAGKAGQAGDNGPKGQKGDRGDQGYKGPEGDAGPHGPKGNDTKKMGDNCECLKQPIFSDAVFNYDAHAQRSVDTVCAATGNPSPEVTVKKVSAAVKSIAAAPKNYEGGISTVSSVSEAQEPMPSDTDTTYECTATNMFGTVKKHVKLRA